MIRFALALSFSFFALAAQAQLSPVGLWRSIDDESKQPKAEIRIAQNAAFYDQAFSRILNIKD